MRIFSLLLFIVFASSGFVNAQISRQEYINTYKKIAIKEMNRTGIPASITLAQGILESANGNSRLAKKANNHFGIKCHSSWKGKTIYKDDDKKHECFRKYKSAYDSYIDHSNFLTRGHRYSFLFEYKTTDYKKWAKGLKKAGYATSKTYASRLIQIIEDYKLYEYDSGKQTVHSDKKKNSKTKKKSKKRIGHTKEDYAIQLGRVVKETNRVKFIIAKTGDTYPKLTDEFQMLRFELYKYNDVEKGAKIRKGQIVYIQPKRNKAESGQNTYIVKKGDSLWSISQKYAIKLNKLLKRNHLGANDKIKPGKKIILR